MAYSGQILDGKYRIVGELGRGGMSVVYLAVDVRLNKKWAVKEIRRYAESFLGEAEVIKNFDHPVLPRIVDVITGDESAFIVMDYIEGRSLNEVIRTEGPQRPETVVRWAESLCEALTYLHHLAPPVIYRDMKPSNIMLKPDGSIRLIDFGAAVKLENGRTSDNSSFGTMGYAAPEQMDGSEFLSEAQDKRGYFPALPKKKERANKEMSERKTVTEWVDARSDIFSLGATMYTLLTGDVPKHSDQMKSLIENSKPLIPERLGKIIIKCMSYYPEDRYESCEELRSQLRRCNKSLEGSRVDIRKLLLVMAIVLTAGCILLSPVSQYVGSGKHRSETTTAGNAKAELFMQMGMDFFEQFKDYKKSAQYFELAERSGVEDAKMYREISLALSELSVDYYGLDAMLLEFGERTEAITAYKRKLDNYKLMGQVYNEYSMYINDSEGMLVEIGEKGLAVLKKCDGKDIGTGENAEYYITFCQYAAIGYEKTGDSLSTKDTSGLWDGNVEQNTTLESTSYEMSEAKECYTRALEYVDRILALIDENAEIVIEDVDLGELRKTKLIKKAEIFTKLLMYEDACRVYEKGEAEYGRDGREFYIGHLSLLCEIEERKTTDVEQWDIEKLIGLYEKGNEIIGIKEDYRWKRLEVKLKPLME